MSATPAAFGLKHALPADSERGACRFRVFYLQINGRRSVVPAWRLHDTMHRLRLLNLYRQIERLEDGASIEFDQTLHEEPVRLLATAGTWHVLQNPEARPAR